MFLRRIRWRYEEIEMNDVRAGAAFVVSEQFDSSAISSSALDNRPCVEFRVATIQVQHAANLEKGLQRRKPAVALAGRQQEEANYLAME